MEKRKYYIDGYSLTIDDIISAIKGKYASVHIAQKAIERCKDSRRQIDKWLEKDAPVIYGVNTGLGNLKDTILSLEDHIKWNKTIPYPHAVGMGGPIDPDITRAALLIRANVLCRGYSAVRPKLIQRMLDIFNAGISPVVLELGSTGLSDLGPLAQCTMVVAGLEEAEAFYKGRRDKVQTIFQDAGLEPTFDLECKEVLSQMNGSTMTQSIAIFAFDRIKKLTKIHKQIEGLMDSDKNESCYLNDKVYLAIEDSLKFVSSIINFENNISCDNPLVFKEEQGDYTPVMGCNCSNTQVGYVLDLLNILIADASNILYQQLCQKEELHPFMRGLKNTALQILMKLRTLSIPASADSIPTKGNQEDHVEFSYGAARKAMKGVQLFKTLIACKIYGILLITPPGIQKEIIKKISLDNSFNLDIIKENDLVSENLEMIEQWIEEYIF
ncbi:aromatic amino acid ammonia-lyase [Natronincola ferrireducens]|uniref:Histidine ammonia-lyase n=1 Tax=Natronincola ferrireducens TaxID=393762 RepID=A0A1G8Z3K1_9FIRM|nr:aromatic amino acid ammonia-lyase [Natronincola ferrireducens]SDK09648.1 Histidine ammonia-lyase [Natronincola ferrireducens]